MHCTQYAIVGMVTVYKTDGMTDEQVRIAAGKGGTSVQVSRFDRCPACEAWTRHEGELRPEIECPAVDEALKGHPIIACDSCGRKIAILPGSDEKAKQEAKDNGFDLDEPTATVCAFCYVGMMNQNGHEPKLINCQRCGSPTPAHGDDYNPPLDAVFNPDWLCNECFVQTTVKQWSS